jgi:PAS domain S-box-containing protein
MLCLALSALASAYYFTEPAGSVLVSNPPDQLLRITLILAGFGVALLSNSQIRALERGRCAERSERQAAERVLRESEERFRDIANTAPAMLWLTGQDGAATFLSLGWLEFTGQTEEEALGFGWLEAVHPDDHESSGQIFLEANRKREPFALDYRVRRADGEFRWAIDSGHPRFDRAGNFLGYIGAVVGITERKLAEEELRGLARRLTWLVENTPLAVVEWDGEFRITRWSGGAERILGGKAADVLGKHVMTCGLVYEDDVAHVGKSCSACDPQNRYAVSRNRNRTQSGQIIFLRMVQLHAARRVRADDGGSVAGPRCERTRARLRRFDGQTAPHLRRLDRELIGLYRHR